MNKIPAAQFRSMFHTIEEPMMVTRYSDTIGTWFPGEHSCAVPVEENLDWSRDKAALEEEIRQLKRKLSRTSPNWQKFPSEGGFGYPRPVPKPKSK